MSQSKPDVYEALQRMSAWVVSVEAQQQAAERSVEDYRRSRPSRQHPHAELTKLMNDVAVWQRSVDFLQGKVTEAESDQLLDPSELTDRLEVLRPVLDRDLTRRRLSGVIAASRAALQVNGPRGYFEARSFAWDVRDAFSGANDASMSDAESEIAGYIDNRLAVRHRSTLQHGDGADSGKVLDQILACAIPKQWYWSERAWKERVAEQISGVLDELEKTVPTVTPAEREALQEELEAVLPSVKQSKLVMQLDAEKLRLGQAEDALGSAYARVAEFLGLDDPGQDTDAQQAVLDAAKERQDIANGVLVRKAHAIADSIRMDMGDVPLDAFLNRSGAEAVTERSGGPVNLTKGLGRGII